MHGIGHPPFTRDYAKSKRRQRSSKLINKRFVELKDLLNITRHQFDSLVRHASCRALVFCWRCILVFRYFYPGFSWGGELGRELVDNEGVINVEGEQVNEDSDVRGEP